MKKIEYSNKDIQRITEMILDENFQRGLYRMHSTKVESLKKCKGLFDCFQTGFLCDFNYNGKMFKSNKLKQILLDMQKEGFIMFHKIADYDYHYYILIVKSLEIFGYCEHNKIEFNFFAEALYYIENYDEF